MNGTIAIGLDILIFVGIVVALIVRFYIGRRHVDQMWNAIRYPPLKDIGTLRHLTILPLIDRKSERNGLVGEAGVSYLIRADNTNILFDVGLNPRGEHPTPLLRNMQALGVTLEQVQSIIISHLHSDHVGGVKNQWDRTFDFSSQPPDLGAMPTLVPPSMTLLLPRSKRWIARESSPPAS